MPYIPQEFRGAIRKHVDRASEHINTTGELNYAITLLINDFLHSRALPVSYDTFNSAIGVLECAKLELARRQLGPYEEKKRLQNGDVR